MGKFEVEILHTLPQIKPVRMDTKLITGSFNLEASHFPCNLICPLEQSFANAFAAELSFYG